MTDSARDTDRPGSAAWRLIEPHWDAVNIYDGPIVFLEGFERLSTAARHLLAIWWCDSEVCNGGFHQFFANATGVLAPEALEGFRAVGLEQFAELAESAISKLGKPYPRDREARLAALHAIEGPGEAREEWDPFYELDDRYYAAQRREAFHTKLDDFARRHAQD